MVDRNTICCFTGHREKQLIDIKDKVILRLEQEIDEALSSGIKAFISGMATGFDEWAAQAVLERRDQGAKLICAVPYKGFCKGTRLEITKEADLVVFLRQRYLPGIFYERNKWMVDNSSLVISACIDKKSGTGKTIRYAEKCGVRVIDIFSQR